MPYDGFALQELSVLFDSRPAGVATLTHDARARLSISVKRDDPMEGFLSVFGTSERPTITSPPNQLPSIRVERAFQKQSTNSFNGQGTHSTQTFLAHEATLSYEPVPPTALAVHRYFLTGLTFVGGPFKFVAGGVRWEIAPLEAGDEIAAPDGYLPVTAMLSSEPVEAGRGDEIDRIASAVLLLCSFAAGGDVWEVRRDQMVDDAVVHRRLRDNRKSAFVLSPLALGLAEPGTLKAFIECCHPHALTAQRALPLPSLVRIALNVRRESTVQTKGLLAAHFLEVLRFHYALRTLCPANRAIRKGRDFFRDQSAKKKNRKLSLADILNDFCTDHRLTCWKPGFITFRNRMFHGLEIPGPTLMDKYWNVMEVAHFCDVVILALLGWDLAGGRYVPCNRPPHTVERSNPAQGGRSIAFGINLQPFVR
jgi:hypothetical protein